ncbi:lantibiotic dehydratase C-terminal domain-containing protein [Vitiosangium sp. GDMCC 1.1324]|uniref:lantibiotic dehydratase C-terminal domain-containing protein n=1 Tax=Vitiosangium sp. (strain GDMCC 1.1324) TaxID=2138576 RepID=UPI000D3D397C|nr:lantibiotic dehydratase C-terminal domain-containing protein [Vitiosangium sp. GDMCC 1.1324]PTL78730.1 hypothetical protein DAT35_37310 [Vitiosangium sp. GDMCC 1.1324]
MWHTWHVVYYRPDKDALLLSGLKPLLERLTAEGTLERFSLRTRWRQGPRVIVDLWARPEREDALARDFEEGIRAWVAAHPSQVEISPEQMLAQHRQLAALELETEPLEPLHPDNSVLRVPYQSPYTGVGPVTERMAQEFYAEASPLLLELLQRAREGQARWQDVLFQILLSLTLLNGDLRYSHFSLRSHCEVFLQRFDTKRELRQKLEAYVQGHQEQLLKTVEVARRYVEGGGEDPLLRQWIALCARLKKTLTELAVSGELTLPTKESFAPRREALEYKAAPITPSEFHKTVLHSRSFQEVSTTPDFLTMRCLLGWHYGIFMLAGLVPLERVKLGYLVSRTAELSVGSTWAEALERGERATR